MSSMGSKRQLKGSQDVPSRSWEQEEQMRRKGSAWTGGSNGKTASSGAGLVIR